MTETIMVQKELMEHLIMDFEGLLNDMEVIVDESMRKKVDQRLDDIKQGRTKGHSEKEFIAFMREEGIDV